ncbi:FAD-dependent oxidoreductase [Sulfurimonas sp.]|uniref:FAD-dependent oxidoreductase n=1 Tax=Sulfurimonas sp. TaxID=2022749 RepID=UPI002AAFA389|nr:FAD-dependent oxidoreductase [Sulfurimonas sp.]
MYDLAIIGAGINGTSVAYEFAKAGKKVIIFDMDGVASGGSGAAGAFIAPKFSKEGELKELLNDAFIYSMKFYEQNFPHLLKKIKLFHSTTDEESSKTLEAYKKNTPLKMKKVSEDFLNTLSPSAKEYAHICIDAGIVNAHAMCRALCKNAKYIEQKVKSLIFEDDYWVVNEVYSAKNILLATGAYDAVIKEPYIKLSGVWGHRIDIKTSTKNLYSIHRDISISPSFDGVIAIGATHDVHYHPQRTTTAYDPKKGRIELLAKAEKTIKLQDVEIVKDFTGLRSGSTDYMPIIGSLVISKETLASKNIRYEIESSNTSSYTYYPNLYMINGSGGYGFVLGPYIAKILKEHILDAKEISKRLSPDRFFTRWAKKSF